MIKDYYKYVLKIKNLHFLLPVVKEELFSRLDGPFGEYTDAMVSIDHHHFRIAIGVDGMVGKAYFITLSRGVHHKVVVEVKKKAAHVFVIDFPAPVRLVLRDDFTAVLRNELIFLGAILQEDAPACDI